MAITEIAPDETALGKWLKFLEGTGGEILVTPDGWRSIGANFDAQRFIPAYDIDSGSQFNRRNVRWTLNGRRASHISRDDALAYGFTDDKYPLHVTLTHDYSVLGKGE